MSSSTAGVESVPQSWSGLRIAIVGRLAGGGKREAQRLLKRQGAIPLDEPAAGLDIVIVGEFDLPPIDLAELIQRSATADGTPPRVVAEADLWRALGAVEPLQVAHRLYTTAMLADLLGVSPAIVRRWQRRKLITAVKEVKRLAYFDFQEVAAARRLAQLLAAGASPKLIEQRLGELRRWLPGVERPLAQLSVIVEGRKLLLRQGDGLLESGGQYVFDFAADDEPPAAVPLPAFAPTAPSRGEPTTPHELIEAALEYDESGRLSEAADCYRAALAAAGPKAEWNFQLADVLYRLGDVGGARERYFAAIEVDEDYVEARANVGCLLAEEGRLDLAVAAFEGALRFHPDYADVHYHLARVLDDADRQADAELHWRTFLELMPDSPWAETARRRLGIEGSSTDIDCEE